MQSFGLGEQPVQTDDLQSRVFHLSAILGPWCRGKRRDVVGQHKWSDLPAGVSYFTSKFERSVERPIGKRLVANCELHVGSRSLRHPASQARGTGILPVSVRGIGILPVSVRGIGILPVSVRGIGILPVSVRGIGILPVSVRGTGILPVSVRGIGILPVSVRGIGILPVTHSFCIQDFHSPSMNSVLSRSDSSALAPVRGSDSTGRLRPCLSRTR